MALIVRPFTYVSGAVILASSGNSNEQTIYNEFNGNIDNANIKPAAGIVETKIDDVSGTISAMQTTQDPYPGAAESLAVDLKGEIERLRFLIKQITGKAQWYIDPDGTGSFTGAANTFTASPQTLSLSTAGVVSRIEILHTDNTNGGSHAHLLLQTGGASGGDPFIRFSTLATDFVMGIDNSDGDKFKIALGSTLSGPGIFEIDPATSQVTIGQVQTIGCKVYRTTHITGLSGSSVEPGSVTWTTVTFDAEEYDNGAMHDTVTNTSRITAPVTGKYFFSATFSRRSTSPGVGGGLASEEVRIRYLVNGGTAKTHGGFITGNSGATPLNHCEEIALTAGDYVEVQVSARGDQDATHDRVMFSPVAYCVCSARRVG